MRGEEIELLRRLVSIPSPTGDAQKAAAFLVEEMGRRGFEESFLDDAGNAVGVAGRGEREILLVGHVDTVPGWIPVRIESGFLHGRGSVDAKGALSSFVLAAQRFVGRRDVRVVVVGCIDEEGESLGARHLLPRYSPEALVIGEPSGVSGVTIGYKGIVKIRATFEEDLSHTGAPFPTVADRAVGFWNALLSYLAPFHGEGLFHTATGKLVTFETRLLEDGREKATLGGSVRTPPGFDERSFLNFLNERKGGAFLEILETSPAWVSDKRSALSRSFVRAIRSHGFVPRFLKKTGTSDMNLLAPHWRCPTIAYGPGDATLDHTPHERLSLEEYLLSIDILHEAIEGYLQDPTSRLSSSEIPRASRTPSGR